jgi:two-component system NtrC family response regulator
MEKQKLMIVEDHDEIREHLSWELCKDYHVITAAHRQEALSLFRKHAPQVVTLDLGLPPAENGTEEGYKCLEQILQMAPNTKVIIITGNNERENACRSIVNGAYDFYSKPLNINELKIIVQRAFKLAAIEREHEILLASQNNNNGNLAGIIGQSACMQEVFATISKVASSDVTVLITGESGTGKELVAKAVHQLSRRDKGPFIVINCGAIPENLLESELFGHEKGSFSGAHIRKQGKVEYSHKGTLFLDEIGELPTSLQVKLLRFLQEKTIQRVGGSEEIQMDTRIVAATNRDISADVANGILREDLYYRISVIHIKIPPLRERDGDILLLGDHFLHKACDDFKKKCLRFSAASKELLERYDWPGNVRELENRVQRAVLMTASPIIEPDTLGFDTGSLAVKTISPKGASLRDARDMVERDMVIAAIGRHKNNMAKAAETLGISRPTLYDLVRKHSIFNKEITFDPM